ncbi:MAG: hypothetical protein HON90_08210, partial [Halobacteriovoraceae bacterium]|nr:hypothetical protein [Halobacteriovoraceae bacterium]
MKVLLCCYLLMATLFAPLHSLAADDFNEEELSNFLEISEEDRYLVFGEYAEVEISAKKAVTLLLQDTVRPYGLELEKVNNKTYLLFGRSEFLGKLCFFLEAEKRNGNNSLERLCLYSEDNDEIEYPSYTDERFLESVEEGTYLSLHFGLEVETDTRYNQTLVSQADPALSVIEDRSGNLNITGTLNTVGVYEFVVKSQELNSEIVSYKQFILEVTAQDNQYQCAPGHYWDEYLKYCVQASGQTCGEGTWYDQETNECRAYRSVSSCSIGTYWDHFQSRCVRERSMNCPLNYEWDGYYNRCIRLPYTCSFNERYDYSRKTCVRLFRSRTCSIGLYWNSFRLSCVRNVNHCRYNEYWSGYSCESVRRSCRSGRYFDPFRRRCTPRTTIRTCRPGWNWNYGLSSCNRRIIRNVTCRTGHRWSRGTRGCVSHDNGRVTRFPRRHRVRTQPPRRTGGTTRTQPP